MVKEGKARSTRKIKVNNSWLDYQTVNQQESTIFIFKLQRTLKLLKAAGFVDEQKLNQAYDLVNKTLKE